MPPGWFTGGFSQFTPALPQVRAAVDILTSSRMEVQEIIDMIKKRRDDLRDRAGFASGFGGDASCQASMAAEYDSLLAEIEKISQ